MLRFRPKRILRDNRILLEVIEYHFGNLNGVFPTPDRDRLSDLGRNRLDGLLLFRLRLRKFRSPGCDNQGRFGLADRHPAFRLSGVQFLPGIEDPGRGEVTVGTENGGLVSGMPFQDRVTGYLVLAVAPDLHTVAEPPNFLFVVFPTEGRFHLVQNADTVLVNLPYIRFLDSFGLHPVTVCRDFVCGSHGPLVDAMVVIDLTIHIDTVGVDMEMKDAAFAVVVQHDNVLAILEIGGLGAGPFGFTGKVNGIELPDEIVSELLPVLQRPSCSLFLGRRDFNLDGGLFQVTVTVQILPEFQVGSVHHRR